MKRAYRRVGVVVGLWLVLASTAWAEGEPPTMADVEQWGTLIELDEAQLYIPHAAVARMTRGRST